MAGIKIRFVLNKGQNGAPLRSLGQISAQAERFLIALAVDSRIDSGQGKWVATGFENSSVQFDAEYRGAVASNTIQNFHDNFESIATIDPDEDWSNNMVRKETINEYAKIGKVIDHDEEVGIALVSPVGEPVRWHKITLSNSEKLASKINKPIPAVCSVQGIIHSWFKGAKPPHFQIRELSTEDLVTVEYDDEHYKDIAKAVEEKDTVVIVSGEGSYDPLTRKVAKIKLDDLFQPKHLSEEEFKGLFGSVPDLEIDESWDTDT